jgi:hypothetical protein
MFPENQNLRARIAIGYGLEFKSRQEARYFPSLRCPDRLWGQHSLLSKGYRCSFPGGKVTGGGGVMLTTYFQLKPKSSGAILPQTSSWCSAY